MPTFRTGRVTELISERTGLQRVRVNLGLDETARAYVLVDLTGPVALGDEVVCNTTAVELSLGTGGGTSCTGTSRVVSSSETARTTS